jgi:forespore regulator of the sigma-K checkpoint
VFRLRALKELKKRLKRQRRPIWSLGAWTGVLLAVALAAYVSAGTTGHGAIPAWTIAAAAHDPAAGTVTEIATRRAYAIAALEHKDGEIEVAVHRVYLCGEETKKLGRMRAAEAANLLKAHREWDAAFDRSGRLSLQETVDDLSPACKMTAYMGMDKDGNLKLYDGPPNADKVVRTFFQLDVRAMETNLSPAQIKELASGIRVSDRDEYNSVLSTYSDYARYRSRAALNPQPQP